MDLLTCTISVYEFLTEDHISELPTPKMINMSEKLSVFGNYDMLSFTIKLRDDLKFNNKLWEDGTPKDFFSSKESIYFYENCITLLQRKKKLEKLMR